MRVLTIMCAFQSLKRLLVITFARMIFSNLSVKANRIKLEKRLTDYFAVILVFLFRFSGHLSDMTPYNEVFIPIMILGLLVAVASATLAGFVRGWIGAIVLLLIGIFAFWQALSAGSDLGYRAWQAIPDPPKEAYSDAGPAIALVFGWIPSTFLCGFVFGVTRVFRWALNRTTPVVSGTAVKMGT